MRITFTTLTDALAYVDDRIPDHDLTDDDIRTILHASDVAYGTPMSEDDPRLDTFLDAVLTAERRRGILPLLEDNSPTD